MAEINVERKRTSVWVWVVGLLLAALLIWGLAELFGGGDDAPEATTVEPVGELRTGPPPVAAGLRIS